MTRSPAPVPVLSARAELLALAAATRPDLDPHQLTRVLDDYLSRGTDWRKVLVQTVLMCAHGTGPRELDDALADPTQPRKARP